MSAEFWIKSDLDNLIILLPVTPSKYDITYANTIQSLDGIVGDINISSNYKLSTVAIEGFFTVQNYPFVNKKTVNANTAMDYVDLIKMLIAYRRVVRFIITQDGITKVNLPYLVESINYKEEDGSKDIYYTITLREYRPIGAIGATVSDGNIPRISDSLGNNGNSPIYQNYHTVVEDDSLKKLARKYYNDTSKYIKIWEANKDKIKNEDSKLTIGTTLIIPQ